VVVLLWTALVVAAGLVAATFRAGTGGALEPVAGAAEMIALGALFAVGLAGAAPVVSAAGSEKYMNLRSAVCRRDAWLLGFLLALAIAAFVVDDSSVPVGYPVHSGTTFTWGGVEIDGAVFDLRLRTMARTAAAYAMVTFYVVIVYARFVLRIVRNSATRSNEVPLS
jgi:hypothetical protein